MKLFKRQPRPADDLGYGMMTTAIKWLGIIVILICVLVRIVRYLLQS